MADLTQTAANVRQTATTKVTQVTAGETISPGMPLYKLAADGEYYKAIDTSAVAAACVAISLGYADDGDPVSVATGGSIDLGATLTIGETYYVSAAGAIQPCADVGSGDFVTVLGIATTAALFAMNIQASGVARA